MPPVVQLSHPHKPTKGGGVDKGHVPRMCHLTVQLSTWWNLQGQQLAVTVSAEDFPHMVPNGKASLSCAPLWP